MTTLSTSEIAMKRRVSLMLEINVNENRRDNQRMTIKEWTIKEWTIKEGTIKEWTIKEWTIQIHNTTQKTKKISNTDPHQKNGVNTGARER
jgi:hypothetical protein